MTLDKLARVIVDDYYNGGPDEMYSAAVEREKKYLKETMRPTGFATAKVEVEVELFNED